MDSKNIEQLSKEELETIGNISGRRLIDISRKFTPQELEEIAVRYKTMRYIKNVNKKLDFWESGYKYWIKYVVLGILFSAIIGGALGDKILSFFNDNVPPFIFGACFFVGIFIQNFNLFDLGRVISFFSKNKEELSSEKIDFRTERQKVKNLIVKNFEHSPDKLTSAKSINELIKVNKIKASHRILGQVLRELDVNIKRTGDGTFYFLTKKSKNNNELSNEG